MESESILEEIKKLLEQLDVSYAKEEEDFVVGNDALVNRGRYTAPGAFSEEDAKYWHPDHKRPLYLSVKAGEVDVRRTLVDNGSSINIVPFGMLKVMGISPSRIRQDGGVIIYGVGNVTQSAVGSLLSWLTCGDPDDVHEFKVLKATPPIT